jgi:ABC-type dipeptide/oligopeptide/nickel transport system permease component
VSSAPLAVGAAVRADLGLDRPPLERLADFLADLARGDLGTSISYRAPVAQVIAERWPATLELAAAAFATALLLALPLGVLAGVRPHGLGDRLARLVSLAGTCLPSFWLGPLLILVFAFQLGWLPVSGRGGVAHLVLPALTLALGMAGVLVRLTRASLLLALREDHVRTARAKGAGFSRVLLVHALRTALVPVVTVASLQGGALLAGAIVTETVFAWPGLGRLMVQAIATRDYPLVQGCVLVLAASYVVVNALADVLAARLDPRLRDAA